VSLRKSRESGLPLRDTDNSQWALRYIIDAEAVIIRLCVDGAGVYWSADLSSPEMNSSAAIRRVNGALFATRALLGALILGIGGSGLAQKVPVVEKTLSNGMRLLLVERHDDTTIAGGWVAHVGSANERPGITGIAHLFEHMMFKGTPTIGTKNYEKDLEIIANQEKLRDQMRRE